VHGEFRPQKAFIQLSACLTTGTFPSKDTKITIRPRRTFKEKLGKLKKNQ